MLDSMVNDLSLGHFQDVMTAISKKRGYLFLKQNDLTLSVHDCIALRDYVGVANNGLHRIKQSIESLCPVLRGVLLPANMHNKVRMEDRKGLVLPRVVEVCARYNERVDVRE